MPPRKRARKADAAAERCVLAAPASDVPDILRDGLIKLWRDGSLCDVELSVDSLTFQAHRVVLSATSDFFKALLSGEHFAESSAHVVTISDVGAAAFEHVLEFIYTRTCTLELSILQEVLEAACRMGCVELQSAAEVTLIQHLSASTCLDAWDFADHFSLAPLTAAAKKTALESFEDIVASSGFVQMPAVRLDALLAADDLVVKREEVVFSALETWTNAQATPPDTALSEKLLSRIRFPLMQKESRRGLEASPLVQRHPMVLVSAYREEMLQESTARTRRRKLLIGSPLTFELLRVGMRVRVMDDLAFVRAECEKPAPGAMDKGAVEWGDEMEAFIGNVCEITELNPDFRGALLDPIFYMFPYTTLLLAE